MPTVRQLAKLAGVSTATISRALSGSPNVLPETRARILALAEKYHYAPNRYSHGVLTGRSQVIGVVIPDISAPYDASMMKGVFAQCNSENIQVLIQETHYQFPQVCMALETAAEHRTEGVIVASGTGVNIPQSTIMKLWSNEVAIVLLDCTTAVIPLDRVRTDEDALATLAITYLQSLGHRRIAFVGPPLGYNFALRTTAIWKAFRKYGLSTDYMYDSNAHDDMEEPLQRIFAEKHRPTAIIGFHDIIAMKLIKMLQLQGVRVPEDISVMGCGNLFCSTLIIPELTTIEQRPEEIGKRATQILLERITEKQFHNKYHQDILVAPQLVVRQSCAPL